MDISEVLSEYSNQCEPELEKYPLKQLDFSFSWEIWRELVYFSPYEMASIIHDLDPYDSGNQQYKPVMALMSLLGQYVKIGNFGKSKITVEQDGQLGSVERVYIHRDDFLAYCEHIGKPMTLREPPVFNAENQDLAAKVEKQQTKIQELTQQIEQMRNEQYNANDETKDQMIVALTTHIAETNPKKFTRNGKVNKSEISRLCGLSQMQLLFKTPKGEDTYRGILSKLDTPPIN